MSPTAPRTIAADPTIAATVRHLDDRVATALASAITYTTATPPFSRLLATLAPYTVAPVAPPSSCLPTRTIVAWLADNALYLRVPTAPCSTPHDPAATRICCTFRLPDPYALAAILAAQP